MSALRWRWLAPALWLLLLGPLFFLLYGGSNQHAASLDPHLVGVLAWDWERHIPLWPWTIVPYWSIDLMFGLSLFLCRSRQELRVQGLRLLLTTVAACAFFMLFPLRFSFERPLVEGLFAPLFIALAGFDQPFNQAPSLHIALLVVIWSCFRRHLPARLHPLLHGWCLLIGLSVLTTWQHHVLDIPTGAALGFVVCYVLPWPERAWIGRWQAADKAAARRLLLRYLLSALLLGVAATWFGGWGWLLLWPALGLGVLAAAYGGLGPAVWQKHRGRYSPAARVLLWPVVLLIRSVQAYCRRGLAPASLIADQVFVGSTLDVGDQRFAAVLDLTGEYEGTPLEVAAYCQLPLLDLMVPNRQELAAAVQLLQQLRQQQSGPLLVHCALGMTRSVSVVLVWLVHSGRMADFDSALQLLQRQRPCLVLSDTAIAELRAYCERPA